MLRAPAVRVEIQLCTKLFHSHATTTATVYAIHLSHVFYPVMRCRGVSSTKLISLTTQRQRICLRLSVYAYANYHKQVHVCAYLAHISHSIC